VKNNLILCFLLAGVCTTAVYSQTPGSQNEIQAAVIKSKPEPEKPKEIVGTEVKATIVLTAVFTSSGKVTDIKLLRVTPKGLPGELAKTLTKRSIKAAKQIKFTPAMKGGRPVSQLIQIEFNFGPD
jgi:hypothetical protein